MNVAVMGYGTVGSGVVEIINTKHSYINERTSDQDLEVKYILDLRDFPGDPNEGKFTKDFNDILNDDSVKIVAEAMGGVNPAFDFTAKCLAAGKHVVTSNKELVSTRGSELLKIAKENNVNYLFEASVGGGIPLIRPLVFCLAGNEIQSINGILNGTTNFILTKMIYENLTFEEALKIAQDNGYAEKDPTADVEGIDACRKICILASLVSGSHVYPDGIWTEGISRLTLDDVVYAEQFGCVIKLIARAKALADGRWCVTVSPALVPKTHMLAGVSGVFNACFVRGDMVGDVLLYGQGAGKLATASAVVADAIDCAQHSDKRKTFGWGPAKDGLLADPMEAPARLFVRAKTSDKAADTEKLSAALPGCDFAQSEPDDLVFVTPEAKEGALRKALGDCGLADASVIRLF